MEVFRLRWEHKREWQAKEAEVRARRAADCREALKSWEPPDTCAFITWTVKPPAKDRGTGANDNAKHGGNDSVQKPRSLDPVR